MSFNRGSWTVRDLDFFVLEGIDLVGLDLVGLDLDGMAFIS